VTLNQEYLAILQEFNARKGYIVVACHYPKDMGQILSPEDPELQISRLRVIGETKYQEIVEQCQGNQTLEPGDCRFFYRCEVLD
jgi:hypothetical protein